MTLQDVIEMRGSAQMIATYKHVDANKFAIQFLFKDGSSRKIISDKTYRTKTQLMHDWLYNRYKFSKYNYAQVKD